MKTLEGKLVLDSIQVTLQGPGVHDREAQALAARRLDTCVENIVGGA